MKQLFSKMALTLALVTMLAFLIGGTATASARSTMTPSHGSAAAVGVPLVTCPVVISEGSQGVPVATLQRSLNELFRDFDDPWFWVASPDAVTMPLPVDGIFGPTTRAAVIDFQTSNGLTAN